MAKEKLVPGISLAVQRFRFRASTAGGTGLILGWRTKILHDMLLLLLLSRFSHFLLQCMKVKSESEVAQSCSPVNHPMDRSPPGPSVHGIFQARVLEWAAIAFSMHDMRQGQKPPKKLVPNDHHFSSLSHHHQIRGAYRHVIMSKSKFILMPCHFQCV